MKSKVKEAVGKLKSSEKKWFYVALMAIVVVGLIGFGVWSVSEAVNYNKAFERYEAHKHSSSCYEKSLRCTISSYWHDHDSSCYKEELDCSFSGYYSAERYADRYSDLDTIGWYFILFIVAVIILFLCIRFSHKLKNVFKNKRGKFNDSFDETDGKWIVWFKKYIKAWFVLEILATIAGGIYCIYCYEAPLFLLLLPGGVLVALVNKCINMIILQYLNNINSIRINTEKLVAKAEEKTAQAEEMPAENED